MTDPKQFEKIALQAVLPGLNFMVNRSIETLNEVRTQIGLPRVMIDLGTTAEYSGVNQILPTGAAPPIARRGPARARHSQGLSANANITEPQVRQTRKRRAAGSRVGSATQQRWDLVRQAGIDTGGRAPTKAQVAQAQQILGIQPGQSAQRGNGRQTAVA